MAKRRTARRSEQVGRYEASLGRLMRALEAVSREADQLEEYDAMELAYTVGEQVKDLLARSLRRAPGERHPAEQLAIDDFLVS